MQFGFSPVQSQLSFDAMQAQARMAEACGFDVLWIHEHHSLNQMYPDPLMALAALAPVTQRIGLGSNMLLLPIHHPVRIAQAAAMLDVMSGGRLHLGVANGYSPDDLQVFGMTSARRGARMSEGLELIRALWTTDEVTRSGENFTLKKFSLFPRPVQKPRPLIYVGGHASAAIRRAACLGDRYFISTTQRACDIASLVASYHGALRELGLELHKPLLNRIVCTVASKQQKAQALKFFADIFLAAYGHWGHDNVAALAGSDRKHEELNRELFIIGEPAECIDRIHEYEALGIGHIACLMNFGGCDLALADRSLRLFGEKVLPAFA